ncbi:hypothetical protein M011DRAFT_476720 [Sporormia fimetaria CBS 119925]|uniref:F-box domain-containing protein n=1 Tax=Sporormia fimetaria CBS 119925 TaxID=1340428 RepID=A0A6A6VD42_9PLEO|nr:hypothetical protein M011DRAFT_476720 [Sporormia fimetaria CBS 119925]
MASFHTVPTEILKEICLRLPPSDLVNVSLVCQKLRFIAQEALCEPLNVPLHARPDAFELLLRTLIDHKDTLAKRIGRVNITSLNAKAVNPKLIDRYYEFARASQAPEAPDCCLALEDCINRPPHERAIETLVTMLATIAPNFKVLECGVRPLLWEDIPVPTATQLASMQVVGKPFRPSLMRVLTNKLTAIKIKDPKPHLPHTHNIILRPFKKLTRLSVPIDIFIWRNRAIRNLTTSLPESVESLEIRGCNLFLSRFLLGLFRFKARNSTQLPAPRLKRLAFGFDHLCLRSGIIAATEGVPDWIKIMTDSVRALHVHGTSTTAFVNTYTSCKSESGSSTPSLTTRHYTASELSEELECAARLSLEELVAALNRDVSYSEMVARDDQGRPRRRSQHEIKLLYRFPRMPLAIFTSRNFKSETYSRVRMFGGMPSAKKKTPKTPKPDSAHSPKEPQLPSSVDGLVAALGMVGSVEKESQLSSSLTSFEKFAMSFQPGKSSTVETSTVMPPVSTSTCITTTFQAKAHYSTTLPTRITDLESEPRLLSTSPALPETYRSFEPSAWLDVNFFPTSSDLPLSFQKCTLKKAKRTHAAAGTREGNATCVKFPPSKRPASRTL